MERFKGQRNLYVIGQYKDYIINELSKDEDFQLAILDEETYKQLKEAEKNGNDIDYKSLFENYVYDYAFSPDTAEDNKIYVCVDITVPYADGTTFKDLYIYSYVFAPKSYIRWNKDIKYDKKVLGILKSRGYCGNKVDVITDIIDRKLNGMTGMTIGKLAFAHRDPVTIFNAQQGYYGKLITYIGSDINILPSEAIIEEYKDGELDFG